MLMLVSNMLPESQIRAKIAGLVEQNVKDCETLKQFYHKVEGKPRFADKFSKIERKTLLMVQYRMIIINTFFDVLGEKYTHTYFDEYLQTMSEHSIYRFVYKLQN